MDWFITKLFLLIYIDRCEYKTHYLIVLFMSTLYFYLSQYQFSTSKSSSNSDKSVCLIDGVFFCDGGVLLEGSDWFDY